MDLVERYEGRLCRHELVSCVCLFEGAMFRSNGITPIPIDVSHYSTYVSEVGPSFVNIGNRHENVVPNLRWLESFIRCFEHLSRLFFETFLALFSFCSGCVLPRTDQTVPVSIF